MPRAESFVSARIALLRETLAIAGYKVRPVAFKFWLTGAGDMYTVHSNRNARASLPKCARILTQIKEHAPCAT